MTDFGLDRSAGGIVVTHDAEAHEYVGTGTINGFPVVIRVRDNGLMEGRRSLRVWAHDTPVDPGEPVPEWMRETRAQLGLEAPRRALPTRLVDDPIPDMVPR